MQGKDLPQFEPSGTFYYVKKAIDIIKLDTAAMVDVASDPEAIRLGLAVTAIGGALAVLPYANFGGLVLAACFSIGLLFLFAGFVHLMAGYSKSNKEFMGFVRIIALTGILDAIAAIPVPLASLIAVIWSLVVAVVATQTVYGVVRGRAILCVLLSAAALWLISPLVLFGPLGSFYDFPRQWGERQPTLSNLNR